jgi:RNAse (barnase) inhibitor barstar
MIIDKDHRCNKLVIRSRILLFLIALSVLLITVSSCIQSPSSRTGITSSGVSAPRTSAMPERTATTEATTTKSCALPDINGSYTTPSEVAAYINYGATLDALWDLLSTQSNPLQITLINRADLTSALGDYGLQLIQVFKDAEQAHCQIQFRIMS